MSLKINDKNRIEVPFLEVPIGECFLYSRCLCIKTSYDKQPNCNSYAFETKDTFSMPTNAMVVPVNVEINIL